MRAGAFAIVFALACAPSGAAADPGAPSVATGPLHLKSTSRVVTDGGSRLTLEPGYYLTEPQWVELDGEVKRLQDQGTRLTVENQVMRAALQRWQPGWRSVAITLVVGVTIGAYVGGKL